MLQSMTTIGLTLLLAAPRPPGQDRKPVCELLTGADVAAVAGEPIKQTVSQLGADACSWTGQRLLSVARIRDLPPDGVSGMLGAAAGRAAGGATVREEPGLGDRAVSEIAAGGRGLDLWVASGSTVWRFTVSQFAAGAAPGSLLPAVKALAARVL